MGGGPTGQQKQAATDQQNLANQQGAAAGRQEQFTEAQQNKVNPFYSSMMQNGLPYASQMTDAASGLNARAFAPARQALNQQLGTQQGLPSGFATQARTDLNSNQAQGFDQQLLSGLQANQAAKQQGAAGLMGQAQMANATGLYSGASSANNSVMQAPLQSPGMMGVLGGVAGGLASNAKLF
jgi:hypothetical protein